MDGLIHCQKKGQILGKNYRNWKCTGSNSATTRLKTLERRIRQCLNKVELISTENQERTITLPTAVFCYIRRHQLMLCGLISIVNI